VISKNCLMISFLLFDIRNQESMGTWWPCICCDLQSSFGSCNFGLLCRVSFLEHLMVVAPCGPVAKIHYTFVKQKGYAMQLK